MNKQKLKESSQRKTRKFELFLHQVQNLCFLIATPCGLTIFLTYRFLRPVFIYELILFLGTVILALLIGIYWLISDFLTFRKKYLDLLDKNHPERIVDRERGEQKK